jgi:hypothetical protein
LGRGAGTLSNPLSLLSPLFSPLSAEGWGLGGGAGTPSDPLSLPSPLFSPFSAEEWGGLGLGCRNAIEFNSIPSVRALIPGGYDGMCVRSPTPTPAMQAHRLARTLSHTRARTHTHTHDTRTHVHTHAHARTHTHTHTHTHTRHDTHTPHLAITGTRTATAFDMRRRLGKILSCQLPAGLGRARCSSWAAKTPSVQVHPGLDRIGPARPGPTRPGQRRAITC